MNPVVLLVRTVHTVQQTVDFHRYSSWYGCHAPVVVQRQVLWLVVQKTVESPQLQWFLGVVQFLNKVVVPVGATTGSAQCLVRLWIHAPLLQGGL